MSKEPAVKRGAKKPAAKKPVRKPPIRKQEAGKADDAFARLLECAGLLTDDEAEDLARAVRLSREE
jgi:hypothetical protein